MQDRFSPARLIDLWLPPAIAVAWLCGQVWFDYQERCGGWDGATGAARTHLLGSLLLPRLAACGLLFALPWAVARRPARWVALSVGFVLVSILSWLAWVTLPAVAASLSGPSGLQSPDPMAWGPWDLISAFFRGRDPFGQPLQPWQEPSVWGLTWYRVALLISLGVPFLAVSLLSRPRRPAWWWTVPVGLGAAWVTARMLLTSSGPSERSLVAILPMLAAALPSLLIATALVVLDRLRPVGAKG